MAAIVQRASAKTNDGDTASLLTDTEKRQLLEAVEDMENE